MKDKTVAALLAFFLGWAGVHKFYLRQPGLGLVYLVFAVTGVPFILSMIDFLVLALMDGDEFNRRHNNALPMGVTVNMLPPGQYPPAYPPHPYAGRPIPQPPPPPPRPSSLDPDELGRKLEKLNELRISGLLTEEEFNDQKARLLGQL